MSALECRNPCEFPSPQHPRCKAVMQVCVSRPERQLEHVVENQPVSQIVVRRAALFLQVERISRNVSVSARCNQRVGCIVNRVRPCIGSLELHSMAELFSK